MVNYKNLSAEFEKSLSAFCNWSLEKDEQGKYIDKNTQYAWCVLPLSETTQ